eukprot:scaffold148588_cov33-Tisochrysis_lutea.AAC.3
MQSHEGAKGEEDTGMCRQSVPVASVESHASSRLHANREALTRVFEIRLEESRMLHFGPLGGPTCNEDSCGRKSRRHACRHRRDEFFI